MTFWPRFSFSRNDSGHFVEVKDTFTLRLASGTEFRGSSCCDSQIGRGPQICKVLPECIPAHPKTPANVHITDKICKIITNYAQIQQVTLNYGKLCQIILD